MYRQRNTARTQTTQNTRAGAEYEQQFMFSPVYLATVVAFTTENSAFTVWILLFQGSPNFLSVGRIDFGKCRWMAGIKKSGLKLKTTL
jgi:hypothetical protein